MHSIQIGFALGMYCMCDVEVKVQLVSRPRYQKVLLKQLDSNFVLETGNKWKDIGYSLVSKVWVVAKADFELFY